MKLEDINNHLKKIPKQVWEKLFALIPKIETTKKNSTTGGDLIEDKNKNDCYIITHEKEVQIVSDFCDIMNDLDLIIPFNWTDWDYGESVFKKREYNNLVSSN